VSAAWSRDTPAEGVVVFQPRRGFRYGSEAFWLVGFALEAELPRTAVDLGTGSGIAAFLLAARGVDALGIDVRDEWAPLWAASLAASTVQPRLETTDVRAVSGRFDLAVSNPPYFATGPMAPDAWKAAARTESTATLAEFVQAALRIAARACFVLPLEREPEAIAVAGGASRRVQVGRRRALVELRPGPTAAAERITEAEARRWYPGSSATGRG
jgi:tRNA1(Val) A37 N6-methylase TrmN6